MARAVGLARAELSLLDPFGSVGFAEGGGVYSDPGVVQQLGGLVG